MNIYTDILTNHTSIRSFLISSSLNKCMKEDKQIKVYCIDFLTSVNTGLPVYSLFVDNKFGKS